MGKSSKAKMQVVEYSMSIHFGICSDVDEVLGICIGEKVAWQGSMKEEGSISISNAGLFGGIKKEGGVKGYAYFLPGGPLQTVPTDLAARFGLTRDTCPGFRGLASIFFVGGVVSNGWTPIPGGGGSDPTSPSNPGGGSGEGWTPPGGGGLQPIEDRPSLRPL